MSISPALVLSFAKGNAALSFNPAGLARSFPAHPFHHPCFLAVDDRDVGDADAARVEPRRKSGSKRNPDPVAGGAMRASAIEASD
ncbi:hypothetical protein [Sphingopyxis soli]|jgi:hypothetical protein|uniref:hypothetical protein n=1 Tax=Sphingopyxis soli TaxID=592051 RepID=UPI001BFD181C|nr:hypothetical protein [Sphingopyxis soli]